MNAIQKLYPMAMVKYKFINRGKTPFPEGFDRELRKEIDSFSDVLLTREEEEFITSHCSFYDPVFIDLLKGYRFNPDEVKISQKDEILEVEIDGPWYRTTLWEVPLLATISELFFLMKNKKPAEVEERATRKALKLNEIKAEYSDFGTRRRFSFNVQDRVIKTLKEKSGIFFKGTSNVYFAMKYNLTPIGTHPHEWFMYHASQFGYLSATSKALDGWIDVYKGDLGIALSDTFTSDNFFKNFSAFHAKLFDGLRHDSGDPFKFADKALDYYKRNRIDPLTKTIVFSDALNIERIEEIKKYVNGRIHDVYGIGTFLTNDVGINPLNMVIKLMNAKQKSCDNYRPTIKLSDEQEKSSGDPDEIELCKKVLNL